MKPAFISVDWGTSSLRATLVSDEGSAAQTRSNAQGVMTVADGNFRAALDAICGDWIAQYACPVLASGMVGSRQGWIEAPYLSCPATPTVAAGALTTLSLSDEVALHIIPGVRCGGGEFMHDVMRGEETQIWGADAMDQGVYVLPGTHSKWAFVSNASSITHFSTFITGELYALLTTHGILGRLMEFGSRSEASFAAGVSLGLNNPAQVTHIVFAARTARLMDELPPAALPDYLSGILIGVEVAGAMGAHDIDSATPITLIGDAELCGRYRAALALAGARCIRECGDATMKGHVRLAREAGILDRVTSN